MNRNCKECPHVVRNKHNDMIISFADRQKIRHNCHMINGGKNLWNVESDTECFGSKNLNKMRFETISKNNV